MATEQSKQNKVASKVREDSKRSTAGDAPFAGDVKSPDELRGQRVVKPVESTFDERTGVVQPFLRKDGSQDNGVEDLAEPEGARRETTREGDKTTAQEAKKNVK